MYYCFIKETEEMLGQLSIFLTKLHLAHYCFHDQVYYQVHLSGLIFVHAVRDMRTLNFSRFDIVKMNTHVLLLLLPPRNLIFASFV